MCDGCMECQSDRSCFTNTIDNGEDGHHTTPESDDNQKYHSNKIKCCVFKKEQVCESQTPDEMKVATDSNSFLVEDRVHNYSDKTGWITWAAATAREVCGILCRLHGERWTTHVLHVEHVKQYAPHVHHLVLDLKCEPSGPD